MAYVAVFGFFAGLVALMLLTAVNTVAAVIVAAITGSALMVAYFLIGRRTVLIDAHPDDLP